MSKLVDGGERTVFSTGATREITDKGRCDLVNNAAWFDLTNDDFYHYMDQFIRHGTVTSIYDALVDCITKFFNGNIDTAYLEVSKHYQDGAKKYAERNMEKGLPFHSLVDSALRHYAKAHRGDKDEPHERAVIWNLLTLLYMVNNKPELNDLPYGEENGKI